jgi:magnesium transporter
MVATAVVARFEETLEATVAVAFFVPAIVYLADAVGTQTEAIAVRGLSHERRPLRRLLPGEMFAGVMIGLVLGAIALPAIVLAYDDVRLGLAVAISITVAGGIATTVGLLFPWLLSRFGADPAFGSGPVATIVQDVLSLLTYFVTVSLLL